MVPFLGCHNSLRRLLVQFKTARIVNDSNALSLVAPPPATVDADHLELGVQESMAVGAACPRIVDEKPENGVSGDLVDVLSAEVDWQRAAPEVLSAPPAGLAVSGDAVEGAALVGAEMAEGVGRSDIVAVVLGSQVEAFVPLEAGQFLVAHSFKGIDSVLNGASFLLHDSGAGVVHFIECGEECGVSRVCPQFVGPVVDGTVQFPVGAADDG